LFILGVTVEDRSPIKILKRELNRIKKRTMLEVAEKFKKEHIRPRFSAGNSRRWRHARRDPDYLKRKKKQVGHNINLVLTGQSKRAAIHNSTPRGTSKGGALVLTGMPRHFFYTTARKPKPGKTSNRGAKNPDKVKELAQVNRDEIEKLRKFARKRMLQRIKRLKAIRKKRLS